MIFIFVDIVFAVDPIPDIKANGSDGPITITTNDALSITVELNPGGFDNINADWWVAAYTPWGDWFYYVYPNHWENAGPDLNDISFGYQGSLFNLIPFEVLNISGIPVGIYNLYFGVDTNMNGMLDGSLYYDGVTVNIQKGVAYQTYGLNFSPYIDNDEDPNKGESQIADDELKERLEIIAPYTEGIRTFGCNDDLREAGMFAHAMGLKAAIGAWLGPNLTENQKQIDCLIDVAKSGYVDLAIVGSEVLLRGDLPENALLDYINHVKQEVPEIPVTYADVYGIILSHPSVIDTIDVVLVNYYPYWEGIRVDKALAAIHGWYQQVISAAKAKQVIVSETGWPSDGNQIGNAVPSQDNASFYFLNFVSWACTNNVDYFYFKAFDETWKAKYEGPQGAHWGVWDKFGNLKPRMEAVFNGETMEDNWSSGSIPCGPGEPTIEFTYVPPFGSFDDLEGQICHVNPNDYKIAVYIYVSGWWTKPYWDEPLTSINTDGSWVCDITTGGIDETATKIVAYLLPNGYNPPLMGGEATLPRELDDNAVAKVETERSPL